jgi:hypothetical protein
MAITLAANFLAFITCAQSQWKNKKWATRKLTSPTTCSLTHGDGYRHIMVIKCPVGSRDLEALASGNATPCGETLWISLMLATLWMCLLISVSGLEEHAWFLVAIGGIGVLQNIYAAGVSRDPGNAGLHPTPSARTATIIGRRGKVTADPDSDVDLGGTTCELDEGHYLGSG